MTTPDLSRPMLPEDRRDWIIFIVKSNPAMANDLATTGKGGQVSKVARCLDPHLQGKKQERHNKRMKIYQYLFCRPFAGGACLNKAEAHALIEWAERYQPLLREEMKAILEECRYERP